MVFKDERLALDIIRAAKGGSRRGRAVRLILRHAFVIKRPMGVLSNMFSQYVRGSFNAGDPKTVDEYIAETMDSCSGEFTANEEMTVKRHIQAILEPYRHGGGSADARQLVVLTYALSGLVESGALTESELEQLATDAALRVRISDVRRAELGHERRPQEADVEVLDRMYAETELNEHSVFMMSAILTDPLRPRPDSTEYSEKYTDVLLEIAYQKTLWLAFLADPGRRSVYDVAERIAIRHSGLRDGSKSAPDIESHLVRALESMETSSADEIPRLSDVLVPTTVMMATVKEIIYQLGLSIRDIVTFCKECEIAAARNVG